MTREEIAAARAACNAATLGPWHHDCCQLYAQVTSRPCGYGNVIVDCKAPGVEQSEADADFITIARTALPAALDEVERLREGMQEAAILLIREWGMTERIRLADAMASSVHSYVEALLGRGDISSDSALVSMVVEMNAYRGGR